MAIASKTDAAVALLATKIEALHQRAGLLASLNTSDKSNHTNAINEILAIAQAAGLTIDDVTPALTTVYSSTRVETRITEAVAAALEGEDISDLAAQVVANAQADANFVSVGGVQGFDAAQQAQGRSNLGAGSAIDVANNASLISTNGTNITTNANAIGDEVNFNPVATINSIITF